jgi:hypothetical protein
MSRYALHVLGEKFTVEDEAELNTGVVIEEAEDLARAFRSGGVLTVPTTRGDVTFAVPDGGLAVWVKPVNSTQGPAQVW